MPPGSFSAGGKQAGSGLFRVALLRLPRWKRATLLTIAIYKRTETESESQARPGPDLMKLTELMCGGMDL